MDLQSEHGLNHEMYMSIFLDVCKMNNMQGWWRCNESWGCKIVMVDFSQLIDQKVNSIPKLTFFFFFVKKWPFWYSFLMNIVYVFLWMNNHYLNEMVYDDWMWNNLVSKMNFAQKTKFAPWLKTPCTKDYECMMIYGLKQVDKSRVGAIVNHTPKTTDLWTWKWHRLITHGLGMTKWSAHVWPLEQNLRTGWNPESIDM